MKFYPSAENFTQAPLVMLVTNIMSGQSGQSDLFRTVYNTQSYKWMDGWMDWIGYLRVVVGIEHLTVLIMHSQNLDI